jgi:hypothetical protein
MKTAYLLAAQYETAVVPIERVAKDYFGGLDKDTFLRKVGKGEIRLPVIRMEQSQKGARGVHVEDLARYVDERREAALKEMRQLAG